jgi:hypothetical protein
MEWGHFGKLIHGFDSPALDMEKAGKRRAEAAERNEWVFCRQAG